MQLDNTINAPFPTSTKTDVQGRSPVWPVSAQYGVSYSAGVRIFASLGRAVRVGVDSPNKGGGQRCILETEFDRHVGMRD